MVDLGTQRLLVVIWCCTLEKTEYFIRKAPDLAAARTFFRTCPVLINVSDEGGGDYRTHQRETFPTFKVLKAERLTSARLNFVRGKNIDRHVYQGRIDKAIISGGVDPSAVFGGICIEDCAGQCNTAVRHHHASAGSDFREDNVVRFHGKLNINNQFHSENITRVPPPSPGIG